MLSTSTSTSTSISTRIGWLRHCRRPHHEDQGDGGGKKRKTRDIANVDNQNEEGSVMKIEDKNKLNMEDDFMKIEDENEITRRRTNRDIS